MDQPIVVPPPLPSTHSPRRFSAPVVVVAIGIAVLLAAGILMGLLVITAAANTQGAERRETPVRRVANGSMTPYELMRVVSQRGPTYRRALARSSESPTRRVRPGSILTFDDEVILDDLGLAMRARLDYRGRARTRAGDVDLVDVEGWQRQYYHAEGAIVVDIMCVRGPSGCPNHDRLLDVTEVALLGNLAAPRIEAILPANASCTVKEEPAAATASCEFESDGLMVWMQKLSLAQTRQAATDGISRNTGARH